MEEIGFKNAKCNILLYRYASNRIKKKQCKRYANLLMYCASDKDGNLVDEDKIKEFLLHEHLIEETSEGIMRTTEQGEYVLVKEILIPEGKRALNDWAPIAIALLGVYITFLSFIKSV
ncbi:MAG: hypothetical protein LUI85_18560 [Bacteroides sp.]|nr:hypothetical protein [Bacteroides sp.]